MTGLAAGIIFDSGYNCTRAVFDAFLPTLISLASPQIAVTDDQTRNRVWPMAQSAYLRANSQLIEKAPLLAAYHPAQPERISFNTFAPNDRYSVIGLSRQGTKP